jgi:hypothetical protein
MKLNAAMIGFGGKVWNNIINANTHVFSPFCDVISSTYTLAIYDQLF